ncbi:NDxxF motif lipoprotein [Staphylococcus xylosus]|uniref:NDxxF motif lipoprotein n=1 Tax=Staphylococcus xylosus TaxID=1288 RepID=UPI000E6928B8|nr:NDxxF motif lipoprotein [Staphylococcus xylosus]RIM74804.1 NDxxF motif lipoprotein [Staphylococcus xylosus]
MKSIKYSLLIALTLLLTACNNAKSEYETPDKEAQATGISNEIFSSQKVDETISEEEMDSSIKKYLDTFNALEENTSKISERDGLSEKDQANLNRLTKMAHKNDENFKHFIESNQIPEQYEKGSFEVSDYVTSVNGLMSKINDKVNETKNESHSDKSKLKAIGEIEDLNAKYKDRVDGKKQERVEQFLKKHDIKTKAFD